MKTVTEEVSEQIYTDDALKNLVTGNIEAMMAAFQETMEEGVGFDSKMDNLLDIFSGINDMDDESIEEMGDFTARSVRVMMHRLTLKCLMDPIEQDSDDEVDRGELEDYDRMELWFTRLDAFLTEAGFTELAEQFTTLCKEIDEELKDDEEECDCGDADCEICNQEYMEDESDDEDDDDDQCDCNKSDCEDCVFIPDQ